jgi:cyanophycin synthetase
MIEYLKKKQVSLKNIPSDGEKIYLRPNANLSTGGKAIDCTEEVCKENSEIALKAAKIIGLGIAGIDIIAKDISKPMYEQNGAIIEVNASPGIRMHLYPSSGHARNVSENIVDYLFPGTSNGRIPIISVTGTNGKTTTTRMINEILKQSGKIVGMTNSSGVYIDGKCTIKGDCTGLVSAKNILMDDRVEVAVLETARGGIVKRGLGYDMADVGIITNVAEDHLGIDGVNNIEELCFVKSLVAEALNLNGCAVLNADDKNTQYMIKRIKSKIIYFSENIDNPILNEHIKKGGTVVCLQDENLLIRKENMVCKLMNVKEIPATHNGRINCNIQNALAACAGCVALGIPSNIIRNGLKEFKCDEKINPGRFNLFTISNFKVLVDYGHNPDGYKEVINYINKIKCKRKIGIIGMPGDRRNKDIEEMADICGTNFDEIYVKEDLDLRGRKVGEVSRIIKNKIKKYIDINKIYIEKNEMSALEKAINNAQEDDLIVIFYEKFEPIKS